MKPLSVIKILFLTMIFSSILVLSLSFALYKFGLSGDKLKVGVLAIYGLSGFFGGFIAGKLSSEKKYIWGFIQGLSYILLLFVISILVNKGFNMDMGHMLLQMSVCTACSVLGGMLA